MSAVIKKQNFPEFYIKNLTSSDQTFQEGKALAKKEDAVSYPYGDEELNEVHFKVNDTKDYHVTLSFYKNGVAKGYQCTCDAFEYNEGACRHVAAAMLSLNKIEAEDIADAASTPKKESIQKTGHHYNNARAIEELISNYRRERQMQMAPVSKKRVNIEFDLEIKGPERVTVFILTMRVGLDYLYIVKDIETTIEDLLAGNKIEFGKKFTYSADDHRISFEDRKMLQLLLHIQQVMQMSSRQNIGDRKELIIPPQFVKEVLEQLLQVDEGFIYYERPGQNAQERQMTSEAQIEKDIKSLPLTFKLERANNGEIYFSISKSDIRRIRFYPKTNMILIDTTFYFLTENQYDALFYLRQAFESVQFGPIILSKDQFSVFASEVLPQVRQLVNFAIDEDISASFSDPDLDANLYLDWRQNTLFVRPVFRYLDTTINPLDSEIDQESSTDKLIIRDLAKENVALEILADATSKFEYEDNYLLTDRVKTITDFLYEDLEVLSEYYEIYMTSGARNIFYSPQTAPHVAIEMNENSNMLDISFEMEEVPEEDIQAIVKSLNQNKNYYRLSDGKILNLKDRAFQEIHKAIEKMDIQEAGVKKNMSVPLFKGLSVVDDESVSKGEKFEELVKQLFEPEELEFDLPETLNADLRSYQETGFRWLKTLDYYGLGGVLADDMGLGKTVQTIAFIASAYEDGKEAFLVVCPSSVIFNWENEFKKFAPSIETIVISGSQAERVEKMEWATENEVPVWITSYPLIQRDGELYAEKEFDTLILDEAQYVKNAQAKTTKEVQKLNRKNTFALSGTPIENHLGELYSLFAIVLPGLFAGPKRYREMDTQLIANKIRPFVLRRLKTEVLQDLPEKQETTEYIELSNDQKKIYQAQLAMLRDDVRSYLDSDSFQNNRMNVLSGMTRLRQICNDPRLILPDYEGDSSKLERLLEILEEARENGKRVVLFSQFTKMLKIIREYIDDLGYSYHYLDGSTPTEDRLELATRFNMGEKDLFLISLKAGGTGMNLTGGDTVILYDSWWNPAVEDQAADRVHRFGQKNTVQVTRMITRGTIEERIHELQDKKRELIDSVIETGETHMTSLSTDDVLRILDM